MWTSITLAFAYGTILLLYGAWAASRVAAGAPIWPFVLALPLVYLAIPFAFVLVWFAVAWQFRAERPDEVRLDVRGVLKLFWREFATVAGNSPRMIAYRCLVRDPEPAQADFPILLVHGVLCNAGVWRTFMQWLRKRDIGPVYALSYGPPLESIEWFADQAAAKIDAILEQTGARRVIVIAHSMGGLVMRAYLRRYGGAKIARLVTLGTPHEGSFHAWLAAGAPMAQMRPRNPWLSGLGHPDGESLPPIVSLWSWHDSMVSPQTSSRVPFGENVEVAGVGHNALLRDPAVFERLLEEIRKARADA